MNRGAKAAENRIAKFDKKVEKSMGAGAAASSMLMGKIGAIGAGFSATALAADAFNRAVSFDALQKGFEAIVGDSEAAGEQLLRLQKIAERPGVGFRMAVGLSRDLQAAGFEARQAEKMISEVANAVALMGGGENDVANVVDAMKDLVAEGALVDDKVDRIAERLPQVRQLMMEAFGSSSTTAVREMGVSAEEFLQVITDKLATEVPRAAESTKTAIDNLKGSWDQLLVSIGSGANEAAGGPLQALADFLRDVAKTEGDTFAGVMTAGELERMVAAGKAMEALSLARDQLSQAITQGIVGDEAMKSTWAGIEAQTQQFLDQFSELREAAEKQARKDTLDQEPSAIEKGKDAARNARGTNIVTLIGRLAGPMWDRVKAYPDEIKKAEDAQKALNQAEADGDARKDSLREKAELTQQTVKGLQQEMAILSLKAKGENEAADALAREVELREEAAQLAERTNLTEGEALDMLKEKDALAKQAADRANADANAAGESKRRIRIKGADEPRLTMRSFQGIDGTTFPMLDEMKKRAAMSTAAKPVEVKRKTEAETLLAAIQESNERTAAGIEELVSG